MVEARFRDALSLSDVADALHPTPAHLTTLVRQATGRTVNAWIAERRMAEARRLLLQTDLYVADVAASSGYAHPAYLHEAVQAATRCKPAALPPAAQGCLNFVQ